MSDSNRRHEGYEPPAGASPVEPASNFGRRGGIRTHTVQILSLLTLPGWSTRPDYSPQIISLVNGVTILCDTVPPHPFGTENQTSSSS